MGKGVWKKSIDGPDDTNMYEGEYLDDKKHGHGIFSWENGK